MDASVITVDFTQIELKVMARFNMLIDRQKAWKAIKGSPAFLHYNNLRKSRSRMLVEAIATGAKQEKGNLVVEFLQRTRFDDVIRFYYRGTLIVEWCPESDIVAEPFCGGFELTSATRNQRKMIREAIEEFDKAVFG